MAIQETRTLPAPFIESLGKDYASQLKALTATGYLLNLFYLKLRVKIRYKLKQLL